MILKGLPIKTERKRRPGSTFLLVLSCLWAISQDLAGGAQLFPTDLPGSGWVQFRAAGFSRKVSGVIYRRATAATCGLPLGVLDTGCLDLETSGLLGYCSIFNTLCPRRGPLNLPWLGLSVGEKTWVLCDPKQVKPYYSDQTANLFTPPVEPVFTNLNLQGVSTAREIHYWGHYPVADLEFDTDAPIAVGLRAWSPFLPGDLESSLVPGIVFEVHLGNATDSAQQGSVALSFPGPSAKEAGAANFRRQEVSGEFNGTVITSPRASYALGVIGAERFRPGGELGADGAAWSQLARALPLPAAGQAGASVAVDFSLRPGESKVLRFVLSWCAPQFKGGGHPSSEYGHTYTHMYAVRYPSALATARLLARQHDSLLRRVLAWQEIIYTDSSLPPWLQDSLVNVLHLLTEGGLWAAAMPPLPEWVRPEDGLFGLNDCPRSCPQIETLPCAFYGNIPVVYFYPPLALSTLRAHKGFQLATGELCFTIGEQLSRAPLEFSSGHRTVAQVTLNGPCWASLVDRYALCWGDRAFLKEFYPSVKKNTEFTMSLRSDADPGDRLMRIPGDPWLRPDCSVHWFEAPEPGWHGLVPHVAGLHLAQLRLTQRLAEKLGDKAYARRCEEWVRAGSAALESKTWLGSYYLNFWEPETGKRSDLVFGYQLDGEWVARAHGLPGVFRADRVQATLQTIRRCNIALSKSGAANYAHPDGRAAPVGGYGTYSYFPPEVMMLAMLNLYEGDRPTGLELARRCWENLVCTWRYTWDMPNIMRGDQDTGERAPGNGGADYTQDMIIWMLPAALAGKDVGAPCRPGGLVDRMLKAARRP